MANAARGRPRDPDIDQRILETTRAHLARHGYEALALSAVAADAGTTRQAVYRRWSGKADLATAAIADLAGYASRPPSDDPYEDLVRELEAFRTGVSRPDGVAMVATMLLPTTDPGLVALYRERVVSPRRQALRAILERALAAGLLDPDADLDIAVTMCTGNWYARALAGLRPPARWAERTAGLVWRAVGGVEPSTRRPGGG